MFAHEGGAHGESRASTTRSVIEILTDLRALDLLRGQAELALRLELDAGPRGPRRMTMPVLRLRVGRGTRPRPRARSSRLSRQAAAELLQLSRSERDLPGSQVSLQSF